MRFLLIVVLWPVVPVHAEGRPDPAVVIVGDSLSAGYGIAVADGWVSLLRQRLAERGYPHRVVNASVTGDTTRGGVARLPSLLEREQPLIVIIELGGNDGLRGITPAAMADNLRRMVQLTRNAGARPLLLGVELPVNYGPAFRELFKDAYYEVARNESVPLVPSFLEGVAMDRALMQPDGIHPNELAQPAMLDTVWPRLEPLLGDSGLLPGMAASGD